MSNLIVFDVFEKCVEAVQQGELIESISAKDKEFHFQNWFQKRIESLEIYFDTSKRNTYPDFCLVNSPIGFEVKGLAWPGRIKSYDCNSQAPSGTHNGRTIFYVFGRYPTDLSPYIENAGGKKQYPVIDMVICHGDFLNADREYIHENKSIKGFGSYGDLMIRDRKMYVAPTPFSLTNGTTGLMTLILPENFNIDERYQLVGSLERTECTELVVGYEFDLASNILKAEKIPNPRSGSVHRFHALRLKNQTDRMVEMSSLDEVSSDESK